MKSIIILWILYLQLLCLTDGIHDEEDLVNCLSQHITNSVTIIKKLPRKLNSSLPMQIIQGIIKKFPTIIFNVNEFSRIIDDDGTLMVKSLLSSKYEQKVMKIVFLGATDNNATQELVDTVAFLTKFTMNSPSPKCAIILMNSKENINFYQFFRYSWSENFLYITVIEIIGQNQDYKNKFVPENVHLDIVVHQYNPFNDSYRSEPLSVTTNFFSNKLTNLYGFSLNTGIFEESPGVEVIRNYDKNNILDAIKGIDVEIMKTASQALNFSFNVKEIYSGGRIEKFSEPLHDLIDGLKDGTLDFGFNLAWMLGRPTMESYNEQMGTFLYPCQYSILIKQYGTYNMEMEVYVIFHTVLPILFISVLVLIMRFERKVWTPINITKILIGQSIAHHPQKASERVFFLCLAVMSSMFFASIIHCFLSAYKTFYVDFTSLDEAMDAGIVPYMVNETKQSISNIHNSVLQTLIETSKTLMHYDDIDYCVTNLLNDENRSVNGCQILNILGKKIEEHFAYDKETRLIKSLERPLPPAWVAMMHSTTSQYVERFDVVLRRMYEAGLMNLWIEMAKNDYLMHITHNLNQSDQAREDFYDNDILFDDERLWSTKAAIYQLINCFSISFAIFICEIIWNYLKNKTTIKCGCIVKLVGIFNKGK